MCFSIRACARLPSRHRFLEPIHNVKDRGFAASTAVAGGSRLYRKRGGASRDRTDDLKLAKLALSQLSYGPIGSNLLASLVGRVGVEPTTSRLSGVRSNHLSYRPQTRPPAMKAAGGVSQLRHTFRRGGMLSRMKGHEDGGNVLWTGGRSA